MHALPPTVFLVFLEVAAGGAALLLWADWRREVSRGFLGWSALFLWCFAAAALWVRQSFPLALAESVWRAPETVALWMLVVALLGYALVIWRRAERPRRLLIGLATAAGLLALGAASLVHAAEWGALATLVSLLLGAASLGAAMVGMVLGHWYLVTPTLSTRPLIAMTLVLLAAAALQGVLLPLQMGALGGDSAQQAGAAALTGTYVLFFGLRVLVGILLPVALAAMTWQTCRLRSMMSATGLLYIAVACVLAGEITAKTLFFLTGIPS